MSTRVGYRAIIIDAEEPAFRLSQYLTRPQFNNRVIQSVSFLDSLADAPYYAEQNDFFYIDPFNFTLPDTARFIADILQRSPVKAFTFYRSGQRWQESLRFLDGLALPVARLRTMLSLDKDLLTDAANFGAQVRNNIASMEREFLEALQHSGLNNDPLARSGLWSASESRIPTSLDYGSGYVGVPMIFGGPGMNPNQNLRDLREYIIETVASMYSRPATHGLLSSPNDLMGLQQQTTQNHEQLAQLQLSMATVQQTISTISTNLATEQQATKTLQEQFTAIQREQGQISRQVNNIEQRVHETEGFQSKDSIVIAKLRDEVRIGRIVSIVLASVLALTDIVVLIGIFFGHIFGH